MKKFSSDDELANSQNPKIFGFNLRTDNELFNEEEYVVAPMVQAKRKKKDDWQIFENNELQLTIKGDKLTLKEKKFLQTAQGMQTLVQLYKQGVNNITQIKAHLRKIINEL